MIGFDMSDVKPSITSFLIVGLMAIAFIGLSKVVVNQFDNPVSRFFRPLVNAV
jgi:hypothetical protein